jgi:hypothetical protein
MNSRRFTRSPCPDPSLDHLGYPVPRIRLKVPPRPSCCRATWEHPTLKAPGVEPGCSPSPLARDEDLADHLRAVLVKCYGELVLLDAFDLAVAEHMMVHGIANRE